MINYREGLYPQLLTDRLTGMRHVAEDAVQRIPEPHRSLYEGQDLRYMAVIGNGIHDMGRMERNQTLAGRNRRVTVGRLSVLAQLTVQAAGQVIRGTGPDQAEAVALFLNQCRDVMVVGARPVQQPGFDREQQDRAYAISGVLHGALQLDGHEDWRRPLDTAWDSIIKGGMMLYENKRRAALLAGAEEVGAGVHDLTLVMGERMDDTQYMHTRTAARSLGRAAAVLDGWSNVLRDLRLPDVLTFATARLRAQDPKDITDDFLQELDTEYVRRAEQYMAEHWDYRHAGFQHRRVYRGLCGYIRREYARQRSPLFGSRLTTRRVREALEASA